MTNESIHRQNWLHMVRYFKSGTEGSIDIELYKEPKGRDKIEAYICNLMVEKGFRRQGIGSELLRWAEGIAYINGYKEVYLEWDRRESTRYAYNMYIHRGYEEVAFGNFNSLLKKKL